MASRIRNAFLTVTLLLASIEPGWLEELSNDPNKSECEHWKDMAKKATGDGKLQTCDINSVGDSAEDCTRLDCTGTYMKKEVSELDNKDVEVDYCFGVRLNSCLKPMSMDVYIEVPKWNVSLTERIRHDRELEIKAMSFPSGMYGHIYPAFYVEFELQPDGNILFSVALKAKTEKGGLELPLETLVNKVTIHTTSCSALTSDTWVEGDPLPDLVPGTCHPEKYKPIPTPKIPATYKPSETLGKSCSISGKQCSLGEMCDLTLKKPVCVCSTEWKKTPKGDACVSESMYGQACRTQEDCSFNEKCDLTRSSPVCRCQQGYTYSSETQMCMSTAPGGQSTPAVPPVTAAPGVKTTTSTIAPSSSGQGQVNGTNTDNGGKSDIMKKMPGILGGVLGALTFLAVGVWCFVIVRRRRLLRSRLSTALEARDGGTDALLGDTDDMIM